MIIIITIIAAIVATTWATTATWVMGATLSTEMMAMEVMTQVVVTMVMEIAGTMVVGDDDRGGGPSDGAGDVEVRDASLLVAQAIIMVVAVMHDCGGDLC